MKCLILLVAVAVCQGFVPEQQRGFVKSVDIPEKFVPSSAEPVYTKQKLQYVPVDKLLRKERLEDRFVNFYTDKTRPWQLHTGEQNLWKDTTRFPFDKFLLEQVEKRLYQNVPSMDVPSIDVLVEKIANDIAEHLPTYWTDTRDPSRLAWMVTRLVVEDILDKRMTCPSVVMNDIPFIKTIQERIFRMQSLAEKDLINFLTDKLSLVAPYDQDKATEYAYMFTKDLQRSLYKDVARQLVAVDMKDVAIVTSELYSQLKDYFEVRPEHVDDTVVMNLVTIIRNVAENCMACPTRRNYIRKATAVCWNFQTKFQNQEFELVINRFKQFLYYISQGQHSDYNWDIRTNVLKDFPSYMPNIDERTMLEIAHKLRSYINYVVREGTYPVCRWNENCLEPYCFQQITEPITLRFDYQKLPKWTRFWKRN